MESKISLTERLRVSGRWLEASAWKDARIKEHRAAGMCRSEAAERAWQEVAEEYPPQVAAPIGLQPSAIYDPSASDGGFVAGAEWVYSAMSTNATAINAPDPGAGAMLEWARSNPSDFFKTIMPRVLEIKAKQGTGDVDESALEELAECETIEQLLMGCLTE